MRMLIRLADTSWGPQFFVPTISIKHYFGRVLLRESLDDDLLRKELEAMNIEGQPVSFRNGWYIRKKGRRHGSRSESRQRGNTISAFAWTRRSSKTELTRSSGS